MTPTPLTPLPISAQTQELPYLSENLDRFFQFMYERHRIWHKRFILNEPAPWTDDGILQAFKFTNIYRELDKATIYLKDHILSKLDGTVEMEKRVLFNVLAYRMINNYQTWDRLFKFMEEFEINDYHEKARRYKEAEEVFFSNAHKVPSLVKLPGDSKVENSGYLFQGLWWFINEIHAKIQMADGSMPMAFQVLKSLPYYGGFLAYEAVVDLSYTDMLPGGEDYWANPGPGCQRGIHYIFGDKKKVRYTKTLYLELMKRLRNEQWAHFERLELPFHAIAYQGKHLTMRNVEHSLCEYQKYMNAFTGKSGPKNKFKATSVSEDDLQRLRG